MNTALVILGFIVGILVGMTGVGGGAVMTPALILFFGVAPIVAVGTDLLFATATKSVAISLHLKKRTVAWKPLIFLSIGSFPMMFATISVIGQHAEQLDHIILIVLGVVLILSGLGIFLQSLFIRVHDREHKHKKIRAWIHVWRYPLTIFSGAIIGVLVALSSIGAGAVGAAVLLFLFEHRKVRTLIGADIAHGFFLSLFAGTGHLIIGTINFHILGVLLLGSIVGVLVGSRLSSMIQEHHTRRGVAVVIILAGALLLVR